MRWLRRFLLPIAAAPFIFDTTARAATEIWRFDFTSSHGGGDFEVDATNFVPPPVGQATTYNVLAANITVDGGGLFGPVHYTLSNITVSGCTTGGECILSATIPNYALPGFGTYDLTLQLNFEKIWVPWVTSAQQSVQMFWDTNPHAFPWNDVGTGQRTVINPVLAWQSTPGSGDWHTASNWATYAVPTAAETAQFNTSTVTSINITQANTQVGGLQFNSGAPAYTFNITGSAGGPASLIVGGTGIDNQSSNHPNFVVGGSAGNIGTLQFANSATASDAVIRTQAYGQTLFTGTSSGGNAQLITASGGTVDISGLTSGGLSVGSIAGAGSYRLGSKNLTTGSINTDTEVSGVISGIGGSLTKVGAGRLVLSGINTYSGGTTISDGTLQLGTTGSTGKIVGAVSNSAVLDIINANTSAMTTIANTGGSVNFYNANSASSSTIINTGIITAGGLVSGPATTFLDNTTAGNATIVNNAGGITQFKNSSTAGSASFSNAFAVLFFDSSTAGHASITNAGTTILIGGNPVDTNGALAFFNSSSADYATITNNTLGHVLFTDTSSAADATIINNNGGQTVFLLNGRGGQARFITNAGGLFDISGLSSGGTTAGSIEGAGTYNLGSKNLTVGSNDLSTEVNGSIVGTGGSLTKIGTGTLLLSGTNTYTGVTNVNAGALAVTGDIAQSSGVTINSGAMLLGTGVIGATSINSGGLFMPGTVAAPGTSMTLASLTLQSGAIYLVYANPTTSSFASVTGNANLGGATVGVSFALGSYIAKQYTILNAGSITDKFDSSVVSLGLPAGFQTSLSYDAAATHAYLNLALNFAPPTGNLSGNQQNVGNAIITYFNTHGSIPMAFGGLGPAGLSQLAGEVGSTSQQTTFGAMTQFLGVMTDTFASGRGEAAGNPGPSMAYAAEGRGRSNGERDAYAAIYTRGSIAPSFEERWSVWAAAFGGSQQTDGSTAAGANTTASSLYGTAVGADYRLSRDTLIGFALAGGGTGFSVANSLGGGRSDMFQAGAFFRHNAGPAYITGALAYGWQDVVTDRTVTVAGLDRLRAEFNANAYSGRLEGGYRFTAQGFGWTPYAAAQFTVFDLPAYVEQAIVGTNLFALAYNAKSVTDTRSELGLRTDKAFAQADGIVMLRGRLAWAHDFNPGHAIGATFQSLPGASFVVNGAAIAPDSALVTMSAEKKWMNGWSAAATFEGEFSSVTRSYAGKGLVRYAW